MDSYEGLRIRNRLPGEKHAFMEASCHGGYDMAYLMGVDLGTSGLKTMLTDETGKVLALRAREYRFDVPVRVAENGEQACLGACIAAGAGAFVFRDIEDGCAKTVRYRESVKIPDPGRHAVYMEYYRLYKELCEAVNVPLTALTRLGRGN